MFPALCAIVWHGMAWYGMALGGTRNTASEEHAIRKDQMQHA
jgi:hypothetical protein